MNRQQRRAQKAGAVVAPASFLAMKERLVEMANENKAFFDGTTHPIKEMMDGNEVVWAVWQDYEADDGTGVGVMCVKGMQIIRESLARFRIRLRHVPM